MVTDRYLDIIHQPEPAAVTHSLPTLACNAINMLAASEALLFARGREQLGLTGYLGEAMLEAFR